MRATLDEVLGAERSAAVHTDAEIAGRLAWHLAPGREAAVLLARDGAGACLGHVLLRVELRDDERFGLFATLYVTPEARRRGVAGALVEAGEAWMVARGLDRARTWTHAGNRALASLFGARGYASRPHGDDWLILSRAL